jgi:ribonuclease PH
MPLRDALAAVSVGIVGGVPLLDLTYEEDSRAEADFNVALTASGEFVEVQGSAESAPFPRATLDEVLRLAGQGIRELLEAQSQALSAIDQLSSSD